MGDDNTPTVRYLPESKGACLEFVKPSQEEVQSGLKRIEHVFLVGTYDCRTCVGLYVKISDDRCLMAHINATSKHPKARLVMSPADRKVYPNEGLQIRDAVHRRLRSVARQLDWNPTKETQYVVCCPMPVSEDLQDKYTGSYVLEAIREFLGKAESEFRCEAWGGFIVDHEKVEVVERFFFDNQKYLKRLTPGLEKYNMVVELDAQRWKFENEY